MRRLATQKRGVPVKSQRDYQTILDVGVACELIPQSAAPLVAISYPFMNVEGGIAGIGGFLAAKTDLDVTVRVLAEGRGEVLRLVVAVKSHCHWTRFGAAWRPSSQPASRYTIEMAWNGPTPLVVWGVNLGLVQLPAAIAKRLATAPDLAEVIKNQSVCPESLYLTHDSPLGLGRQLSRTSVLFQQKPGRANPGKKCAECGRILPIDPRLEPYRKAQKDKRRAPRNLIVSFHGHRSKPTGYQNECRSCKNMGINGHFNVIRTSDQLHESSVLTRERKLLLRESEILQQFKERNAKEGLRTFVWKRFGKKCFNCPRLVTVDEMELDHTRPLAYLWPLDEHATCLCQACNNEKKDAFPRDYYSPDKLKLLSKTVGLPLDQLKLRSVNLTELSRIRSDLQTFAEAWDPRLFFSVATRVRECHPDIDLFGELKQVDEKIHDRIIAALRDRPAPIESLD